MKNDFFFEKKKQKTFANASGASLDPAATLLAETDKSFLVLFFKKNDFLPADRGLAQAIDLPGFTLRRADFSGIGTVGVSGRDTGMGGLNETVRVPRLHGAGK